MPINTRIDGNPDSVRQAAGWLKSSLSNGVHDATTQVHRARTGAEGGWRGDASSAFQGRMGTVAKGGDELATDANRLGQSADAYADALHTAQAGMGRAKEIAWQGGLTVNGDVIEDPGPAPTLPQSLPSDGSASPQQVQEHHHATQAGQDHQRKVAAFTQAQAEADRANGVLRAGREVWGNFANDLSGKRYLHAAEFLNQSAEGLVKKHTSNLKGEASRLRGEAQLARERYLKAPGGSNEAKFQTSTENAKNRAAATAEQRAASTARRFGSKIPVIGLGITAAGIGYDIHTGKPPGKAVASGLAGAAAGAGVAMLATGPVGVVALGSVAAGVAVGSVADYAWDNWVPEGAKEKINEGVKAVGEGISNAGKAVGDFVGSIL